MIPLVGIPHLANHGLLINCIRSVLPYTERVHVIDNSPASNPLMPEDNPIFQDPRVVVTRMHRNYGVGASWNLIMKVNPHARWWCIVNDDIEFREGDADKLEENIRICDVVTFQGMHAFGVRATAVSNVGWFDENFIPGYFEDNDYHYRCKLMNASYHQIEGNLLHHGSMVLKESPHYRAENGRTFVMNEGYYVAKWGGRPAEETFTTPFDRGGSPRDWSLDITRLSNQAWKEI